MQCDRCEKEFDELVTRQGFLMTFFVEWVCKDCYEILQEEKFEEKEEVCNEF